jgi:uncharacterized membrane protein YdjX (TVP38/TMEM64 family)
VEIDTIGELVAWMRDAGAPGVLVYALVYAAAAVCLVPGSILMVAAGVAYGPIWGTLIASPASALAATAAFLVGRTVARRRVAAWAARDPRFAAIDAAVGDRGLTLIVLLRLSPLIPFNVVNYALGLTRVRTRDYALGSLVGMLPVTFLYVYAGSIAGDLARAGEAGAGQPWRTTASIAGFGVTAAVTIYVTRLAKRALSRVAADRAR